MAALGNAVSQLLNQKNVCENFTVYCEELKDLYRDNAYLQLSMNYFTLCQVLCDFDKPNSEAKEILSKLDKLINALIIEKEHIEIEDVDSLRNKIIQIMETLTIYMDKFQLFEYCLNRVEFKFTAGQYTKEYYHSGFEEEIRNYVISERDNSVISAKMSEMIGQLPMRLSTGKFSDILYNTFSLYKGSEKSSVTDFSYMIKTCGGIYEPVYKSKEFDKLDEAAGKFSCLDYENMTKEEFISSNEEFVIWSSYLEEYTNLYLLIAEAVNELYTIALCGFSDNVNEDTVEIIKASQLAISKGLEPDVSVEMRFTSFEGKQEQLANKIYAPESSLADIESINYEELLKNNLVEDIEKLKKIAKLQSSSSFAGLCDNRDNDIADALYVEEAAGDVISDFTAAFNNCTKMTKRAMMASVLQNLPIFFNSFEEFTNYVHVSLTQCRDEAERQACMTLINLCIHGE